MKEEDSALNQTGKEEAGTAALLSGAGSDQDEDAAGQILLAKQHACSRSHSRTHATSPTKTVLVYQLERSQENTPVFPLVTRVRLSEMQRESSPCPLWEGDYLKLESDTTRSSRGKWDLDSLTPQMRRRSVRRSIFRATRQNTRMILRRPFYARHPGATLRWAPPIPLS